MKDEPRVRIRIRMGTGGFDCHKLDFHTTVHDPVSPGQAKFLFRNGGPERDDSSARGFTRADSRWSILQHDAVQSIEAKTCGRFYKRLRVRLAVRRGT